MKNNKCIKAAKILFCLIMVIATLAPSCVVFAEDPYAGYNYNWDTSGRVASPNSYLPTQTYNGFELGIGHFKKPSDIFVDKSEFIYILDAGNNRVVKLNKNFELVKVLKDFTDNGVPSPLKNPQGIFVTPDNEMYICDRDNSRVIVANQDGQILRKYGKPKSDMIKESLTYYPTKIVVNPAGDMYILAENILEGALIITNEGNFNGFFGAERVQLSSEQISALFWRFFMTDEQIEKMISFIPVEYSNMFLEGDFVYTSTAYQGATKDQVKKVNPSGANVLKAGEYFGDWTINVDEKTGKVLNTSLTDVTSDYLGFIFALDKSSGKVYMYDQESNLILIFGDYGDVQGRFKIPVSIETLGDKVMVADYDKNIITVFEPTEYGKMLRHGEWLYGKGKYAESYDTWNEVKRLNSNYQFAYTAIGRVLYMMEDFKGSMDTYVIGKSSTGYSEALQKYRSQILKENFSLLISSFVILLFAFWIIGKKKKQIRQLLHFKSLEETGYAGMAKWKYPFYIMVHPYDGFQELKYNHKGSLVIAGVLFVVYYISEIIMRQYESFVFNGTDKDNINILMIAAATIGLFLVACVANWSICTLMDGKGNFRNIFIFAAYAMLPTIIATFVVTILSHFLIQEEAVFIQIILFGLGYAWSALLIFLGTQVVHEFTAKKAIVMLATTLIGIIVILFLLFLIYTLYKQVSDFISTLYFEILFRFGSL